MALLHGVAARAVPVSPHVGVVQIHESLICSCISLRYYLAFASVRASRTLCIFNGIALSRHLELYHILSAFATVTRLNRLDQHRGLEHRVRRQIGQPRVEVREFRAHRCLNTFWYLFIVRKDIIVCTLLLL